MAIEPINKRAIRPLVVALAFALFPACAARAPSEPPPQMPAAAEAASADAGLPMVPLNQKGVVVPSDVKLEPAQTAATQPTAVVPGATATPTAN